MTRPYRRFQRPPLASLGVLLSSGLLVSCGLENTMPEGPLKDAMAAVTDTFGPTQPPPARNAALSRPRPQPRAQSTVTQEQSDNCRDVPSCETLLRKLTENPDRSWINRPDPPAALLTSVRMFAFRTLRSKLTCGELGIAMEQLRGVPAALRPPPAGSSPEDIARATRLAAEVHDELRAENEARCRAAAVPPPIRPPAPAPNQPPAAAQPPAPGQPTVTTQPPASPPAAQPQPQVTIPDQKQ